MSGTIVDRDWRAGVPRTAPMAGVLLCLPEHFTVLDVKNPFMAAHVGRVDGARAQAQWEALRATYLRLGVEVHVLPARAGCEDMVFTANGAVVLPRPLPRASGDRDGRPAADVVLSRMRHASRQAEIAPLAGWLAAQGLAPRELPPGSGRLEGHGDVLVVPGRRLLLGGHAGAAGRSEESALLALGAMLDVPLVTLPLVGEPFYHLDTCLALLDERTALLHPPAFHAEALERIERIFPRLIEAEPAEAAEQLACNAHALPGGEVLVPAGATRTAERVARAGFRPVAVDVSEFHKSGGSIFCMKLELPALGAS